MVDSLRVASSPLPDPRAARGIAIAFVIMTLACIGTGIVANMSWHSGCKCDPYRDRPTPTADVTRSVP